ncbi:MAG: F0F1 ATP synthase subunit alpha, partial [Candidatus Methylomirabilis sp.]
EVERQILIIYAGTAGHLDELPVEAVSQFEGALYKSVEGRYPGILPEIREKRELSDALRTQMDQAITECKAEFLAARKAA